jgi:hypothetical protein
MPEASLESSNSSDPASETSQAPTADFARDACLRLREKIAKEYGFGNDIRDAAWRSALGQSCIRLMRMGPDEALDVYSARDLMTMLLGVTGQAWAWMLEHAFVRAIVEGDEQVMRDVCESGFSFPSLFFFARICDFILGRSQNIPEDEAWLNGLLGEESAIARLIMARFRPDLVDPRWLDDLPDDIHPMIGAHLAVILARQEKHREHAARFLATHPKCAIFVPGS